MKFIKIFERKDVIGALCTDTIELNKVVDTKLTEEQFEEIADYFQEVDDKYISSVSFIEGTGTIELTNEDEILEDSPLPDGTIVSAKEFEAGGQYIVVMGDDKNNRCVAGISI